MDGSIMDKLDPELSETKADRDVTTEETGTHAMSEETVRELFQHIMHTKAQIDRQKDELEEAQRRLELAKKEFETEKASFQREKDMTEKRLQQQQQLFETKWKILEKEISTLADERREFELHKEFRSRVNAFEESQRVSADYEIFFSGIDNELALRKRYKDLIKIFHPDNLCGDLDTVQEINREYEDLKRRYGS